MLVAASLFQQSVSGLTCSNNVIHHQHVLSLLYSICLNLEVIRSILLFKAGLLSWTRKLSALSDGCKASSQFQGETGTKEKASGVQANNDIWLDAVERGENLEFESTNERLMERVCCEEGKNVNEIDAGDGEIGELAKGGL